MALGKVAEIALFALIDLIRALPGILFALACIVAFEPGVGAVILALGVSFAPNFALDDARHLPAADGAALYGRRQGAGRGPDCASPLVHVLPNIAGALITQFAIILPRCIVSESVLSFLGLGVSPETPTWGRMIASATPYIEEAPHAALAPIIALSLVTFALAIVGNDDAPALRRLPQECHPMNPHLTRLLAGIGVDVLRVARHCRRHRRLHLLRHPHDPRRRGRRARARRLADLFAADRDARRTRAQQALDRRSSSNGSA